MFMRCKLQRDGGIYGEADTTFSDGQIFKHARQAMNRELFLCGFFLPTFHLINPFSFNYRITSLYYLAKVRTGRH
jgi:hypothetical protein